MVVYTPISQYDPEAIEGADARELLFALLDYLNLEVCDVTKAGNHCYYAVRKVPA